MHKLDDRILITKALLLRFEDEAALEGGDGKFFAFMQRDNGDLLSHQIGPDVGANEQIFATDALTFLNKQLHHDGAWVIVFTHFQPGKMDGPVAVVPGHYTRFAFLWMDKDGDVQFTSDCENGIVWAMTEMSLTTDWGDQAETAWKLWQHAMRTVLEPKGDELYQRAKGQEAPTVH